MNDPATIVRSIPTRTALFEERGDGLIVQRLVPKTIQSPDDARANIQALLELVGDDPERYLLFDMRPGLTTESGVREIYAGSEGMKRLRGMAILINSTAGRIAGNFLLAMQVYGTPTRLFTDEASALAWLQRLRRARR